MDCRLFLGLCTFSLVLRTFRTAGGFYTDMLLDAVFCCALKRLEV